MTKTISLVGLALCACFLCLRCSSDSADDPSTFPGYPTTITRLSETDREVLAQAFSTENPGALCVTVDEYGLMITDPLAVCLEIYGSVADQETELAKVKALLVANGAVTHVPAATNLSLIQAYDNSPDSYFFQFAHQEQNGVRVEQSEIYLWWGGDNTFVGGGHHYPLAVFPEIRYDENQAAEAIVGEFVEIPQGEGVVRYEITQVEDPLLVIYPWSNEVQNRLELRACHRFLAQYPDGEVGYVYADVFTGELVDGTPPLLYVENKQPQNAAHFSQKEPYKLADRYDR